MTHAEQVAVRTAELPPIKQIAIVINKTHKPTTGILNKITTTVDVIKNVTITKEMARDLLSTNVNRRIKKALVHRYANDMTNNNWIFQGNMLKFDTNKELRDGQHSLHAIIISGKPQVFNIQTGLHPKSFSVMDNGGQRTGADVADMHEIRFPSAFASALKSVIYYNKFGRLRTEIRFQLVTNTVIEDWITTYPLDVKMLSDGINYIMDNYYTKRKAHFLACSTWGFIYYILKKVNRADATEFITRLAGGENISMATNAPIYLLREKLIEFVSADSLKVIRKGGTAVTDQKVRLVFRAWNAWRKGEVIKKLSINKEGVIEKPQ